MTPMIRTWDRADRSDRDAARGDPVGRPARRKRPPRSQVELGGGRDAQRSVSLVSVIALAGLAGVVAPAAPAAAAGNEVTNWNQIAATTLVGSRGRRAVRHLHSRSTWAWCRAPCTTRSTRSGRSSIGHICSTRRSGAKASIDAAVATAAYDVLSELVSRHRTGSAVPGRAGLLSTLSSEYAASLAAIADGPFKGRASRWDTQRPTAMLDAREGDGRFGPSQWVPNTAPGHWQPLLNAGRRSRSSTRPRGSGGVKPFLIQSSSQFRSAPPPALDSAAVGG